MRMTWQHITFTFHRILFWFAVDEIVMISPTRYTLYTEHTCIICNIIISNTIDRSLRYSLICARRSGTRRRRRRTGTRTACDARDWCKGRPATGASVRIRIYDRIVCVCLRVHRSSFVQHTFVIYWIIRTDYPDYYTGGGTLFRGYCSVYLFACGSVQTLNPSHNMPHKCGIDRMIGGDFSHT